MKRVTTGTRIATMLDRAVRMGEPLPRDVARWAATASDDLLARLPGSLATAVRTWRAKETGT